MSQFHHKKPAIFFKSCLLALAVLMLLGCGGGENGSSCTDAENCLDDETIGTSTPVKTPDNLKAIWIITRWGYMPWSGMWGVRETIVVALTDGRMTDNLPRVFSGASENELNEGSWGSWRKKGDEIETRWDGDDEYSKPYFSVYDEPPGKMDQRLEGCYSLFSSYSDEHMGGDFNFAAVLTWCFTRNGRFAQNVTSTSSVPIAVTSVESSTSGNYRIDGYGMRLTFDDGRTAYTGFAFLVDGEDTITINGNRLQKD